MYTSIPINVRYRIFYDIERLYVSNIISIALYLSVSISSELSCVTPYLIFNENAIFERKDD